MQPLSRLVRTYGIAIIGAGGLLAAAACTGSIEVRGGDRIFDTPPWSGNERFVYRIIDRQIEGEPTCEHLTLVEVRPGETQLEEHCSLDEFSDDTVVVVGSDDLHPIRSERAIVNDGLAIHMVDYGETSATFSTSKGEARDETTRDLPEATGEHPDPGWYDDKSIFWLARGLPLAEGYEATYIHVINVGAPRVLPVDVEVEGVEEVETPLGTFTAWKVRFERDNTVYFLWVAIDNPRPVVRARIEGVTYELIEADTGGP